MGTELRVGVHRGVRVHASVWAVPYIHTHACHDVPRTPRQAGTRPLRDSPWFHSHDPWHLSPRHGSGLGPAMSHQSRWWPGQDWDPVPTSADHWQLRKLPCALSLSLALAKCPPGPDPGTG